MRDRTRERRQAPVPDDRLEAMVRAHQARQDRLRQELDQWPGHREWSSRVLRDHARGQLPRDKADPR